MMTSYGNGKIWGLKNESSLWAITDFPHWWWCYINICSKAYG